MELILRFLTDLAANNRREWYHENKDYYQEARKQFEFFVGLVIAEHGRHDPTIAGLDAKQAIFRIFRDTRFSKSKLPYKTNMGAALAEGGRKSMKPSYYIHIEPGSSFLGGGVYMPPGDVLKRLRYHIMDVAPEVKALLADTDFRQYFSGIFGEQVKTYPRGFDKDFAHIDLLRYKSYALVHPVSDEQVLHPDFFQYTLNVFAQQQRFNALLRPAYAE